MKAFSFGLRGTRRGLAPVTRSVAGAASTAVLLGLVTETAAKMCQASVAYQGSPKDDQ
jgi:hypothetical protein